MTDLLTKHVTAFPVMAGACGMVWWRERERNCPVSPSQSSLLLAVPVSISLPIYYYATIAFLEGFPGLPTISSSIPTLTLSTEK